MGTIELSARELKVLEAIIDNMQEINLEKTVYRIRNIFVVLYNYFKKVDPSINRQAIYYSVEKLEGVGLLKKVAKTQEGSNGCEKVVYELQLDRFDQARIVQIKNRYGKQREISKKEKLPKLGIKLSWFTLEPLEPPESSKSKLEMDISKRRDKIQQEVDHLEELIKQKRTELKEADDAINHIKEATKFLEKKYNAKSYLPEHFKNQLQEKSKPASGAMAKNVIMLLSREKQVLDGIVKYLAEFGGNQIKKIKSTLSTYFSRRDINIKISETSIFFAAKGLEEVGLLTRIDNNKKRVGRQQISIYEFNKELFEKSEFSIKNGLTRSLLPKSMKSKTANQ